MKQDLTKRIGTALLATATVACVLIALLNFVQRRQIEQPHDGVVWADTAVGVEALRVAPEGPGEQAGIVAGDLLRKINRGAIDRAEQVGAALDAIGAWHEAAYGLDRAGTPFDARVIIGTARTPDVVYHFLWVVALAYLAIGLTVLVKRRNESMAPHFYAFTLASFVLYAFSYTGELGGLDRFVYWADVWATLLAPALFLHFCLVFPGESRVSRLRRSLGVAAYLPVIPLLAAYHLAASGAIDTEMPVADLSFLLDRLSYGLLGVYFVLGAALLSRAAPKTEDVVLRQQRRWLAAGALWGVLPFAVFYLIPFVSGQIPGPNQGLSVFSLVLIPLAFAYAIVKHRLMDVEVTVRRGTAYTLATAGTLALFYAVSFGLGAALGVRLEQLGPAVWVVSLVAGALAFQPLRRRIQTVLDRRFYRERYDYRRTLVEFAAELSTETDLDRMLSAATKRLVKTLGLSRMAIFLRDEDTEAGRADLLRQGSFRLACGSGLADLSGRAIDPPNGRADAFDLAFLDSLVPQAGGSQPYLYFENPRYFENSRGESRSSGSEAIAELDLNYYVPCRAQGRTIAYLGLGRTERGDYLSSDDLSLVETVSGSFAIALENVRLHASLDHKAREYERLKDYKENIVESLSVGIAAAGLDDRVESWNTQLELMFGIPRHEAVGRRIGELLPTALAGELDRVSEDAGIHNIYKFRLTPSDFPAEFRGEAIGELPASSGPNGTGEDERERVLNVVVAPLVAKNFDRIGRLIIFDDVTERIELEEQLVQADKLSSIGLLAAGVAHEVNTPLAVISSYAQMLARQVSSQPGHAKMLDKITSQTFRASEIVNSLLSFSRTSTRQFERVDLAKAIRDTLNLVEPQLRHAKIEVETEFDPAAARVTGSAGKLQQVFLNLFLNARDAMPEGGRLRVRTEAFADGPSARITVSDTGVGMSAQQAKRIFDPFFTTKGPQRGTGLGLAVCHGIIQEHSGTMTVESSPGKGSAFHIEIPLERKPVHA